jgi:hypothetical protein
MVLKPSEKEEAFLRGKSSSRKEDRGREAEETRRRPEEKGEELHFMKCPKWHGPHRNRL